MHKKKKDEDKLGDYIYPVDNLQMTYNTWVKS